MIHSTRSSRGRAPRALLASVVCVAALASGRAQAMPGTHPPIVSTWDTTASSLHGGFTGGVFNGGHLHFGSYASSFSSTSGNISAQFGVHYANYREGAGLDVAHGGAGSAAFVYSAPLLQRHPTGLPRLALGFYLGLAPTLLVAIQRNYAWIPAAVGVGLPIAPTRFLSLVPWFELAGGVSIDTVIRPTAFTAADAATYIDANKRTVNFSQADIDKLVRDAVQVDLSGAVSARGGLKITTHLARTVDLGLDLGLASQGKAFAGPPIFVVGGSLLLHWDAVVPAVLTARERLGNEKCEDVQERSRECPPPRSPPTAP